MKYEIAVSGSKPSRCCSFRILQSGSGWMHLSAPGILHLSHRGQSSVSEPVCVTFWKLSGLSTQGFFGQAEFPLNTPSDSDGA